MFQKIVEQKYLKSTTTQDELENAWQKYSATFLNAEKQKHIRESKEEQYQEGFIRDLFCEILGYTINPEPNYNIITEKKNDSDSRKTDGAIIIQNKVRAVIELKGSDTTDLSKVENQAFGYKAHNPSSHYVIISNFEKLRFYIEDASSFLEFPLFNLNREQFNLLYLCLSLKNITDDIPLKMKTETVSAEISITDKFYADYSTFKRNLFEDICQNNLEGESLPLATAGEPSFATPSSGDTPQRPAADKLILFKKTQKLLDRILFILFCEDRGLLPENSVNNLIIGRWQKLKEIDAYQPLYESFKNYFNRINTGWKSEDGKTEIFAYNGGLFKPDDILDNIKISDDVLFIYSKRIAEYDFVSEVSVNILGHIFEHSLSEIDEITNQITSGTIDISKRKKDGVFYTPAYITKYIVENTVGALCDKKKAELGIDDETFSAKRRTKTKIVELDKNLADYRAYLLSLKICDPACGSGAFLNAAYEFLLSEHHLIDELYAKLHGDLMNIFEVDNDILEHNLYGVDINEESVEIAKLSLWLHTAKKGRKLTSLNNNIKCGNSLIDDKSVAGEKAFKWEKEFPQVFNLKESNPSTCEAGVSSLQTTQLPQHAFDSTTSGGGFDVVIGNPPYVNIANIQNEADRKFYQANYKTVKNKSDLYSIFTEKAHYLLKQNGLLGFIFSNSWMGTDSFSLFREFLAKEVRVYKLGELPPGVFADATVTTVLCFYENAKPTDKDKIEVVKSENNDFVSKEFTLSYEQILKNPNSSFAFEKTIELNRVKTIPLGEIASFSLGIKTSDDTRFVFNQKKDDDFFLFLRGRNIKRYSHPENNEYLWYKPELICEKPGGRPRVFENFTVEKKLVIQDIATEITATIDMEKYLCNDTLNIIYSLKEGYDFKYILTLLNSKLINVWFKKLFPAGLHIKTNQLEVIPIPDVSDVSHEQIRVALSSLADKMLSLNADLQTQTTQFTRLVQNNLNIEKLSTAIQNFASLTFADFLKETAKLKNKDGAKAKIPLKDQSEWNETFDTYKEKCSSLQQQIATTDAEINAKVYKLYGLTDDEIKTVERK